MQLFLDVRTAIARTITTLPEQILRSASAMKARLSDVGSIRPAPCPERHACIPSTRNFSPGPARMGGDRLAHLPPGAHGMTGRAHDGDAHDAAPRQGK